MTRLRPTISDVARAAGVSKATVSAVLNDKGAVRADTRERVLFSIEQLNYRPSQGGGRPVPARDGAIALVIKEQDNPYYAGIVDGVRAVVEERGFTLLIVSTGGSYAVERRAAELLRAADVRGLIVTPVLDDAADLSYLFELRRRNIPFVLLEEVRGVPASLVDVDNVAAACDAATHLMGLGHQRLAHLAGPPYSAHTLERVDGFRRAFSASSLVFSDDLVIPAGAHLADGLRAGRALFGARRARTARPTAVTCYNDLVAVGLCRALREAGLRVPDDVSVVGFDDIPLCEYLDVPLTSVHVPVQRMGGTAARILLAHVDATAGVAPQKVFLDGTLRVRASTAPPPADPRVATARRPSRIARS